MSLLRKKILPVFPIICLLFFMLNVNGQNITISPASITVEITGGDILTRNLTFSHGSNSDMNCNISFEILPDGEGINVSFSVDDSFVLKPGNNIIKITINVSDSIMPMIYTVNIYADAEGTVDSEETSKTYGGSPGIIPDPVDNMPADLDDIPVDETPGDVLLLDDNPPDQPSSFGYYIPTVLISILITIFVTLLILYGKRRREKEK